jgi:hypothetical protein
MLRFAKAIIFAGVPFGLAMGLVFAVRYGPSAGLVLGTATGVFFGLGMAAFAAWQRSRFTRQVPDIGGEQLLEQGPANHFKGTESVGGWLYLTDRRLVFRSHRFNVQNHTLSVPLSEIRDAQPCTTAWIVPNGLRVVTTHGDERFVVEGRRSWVEAINRVCRLRA